MPIYTFSCGRCGRDEEVFRWMREMNDPHVGSCGHEMERRTVCPIQTEKTWRPKYNWGLGAWISSARQHDRVMKEKGKYFIGREKGG